jgi:hypothetical protein
MEESLHQLEEQERAISGQRRQIHRRIEYLRGTGAHDPEAVELLDGLIVTEREISQRRRELHRTIDRLRARMDGADSP